MIKRSFATKVEKCLKDLRRKLIGQSVLVILYVFMLVMLFHRSENRIVLTLGGNDIMLAGAMAGIFYPFYENLRRYSELKHLDKNMPAFKVVESRVLKRTRAQTIDIVVGIVSLSLALICMASPFVMMSQQVNQGIPENMETIPSISLTALENNVAYRQKSSPVYRGTGEYLNRLSIKGTLTVPKQYEVIEGGEIPSMMWPDKSGVYSPSLRTLYYEIRLSLITEPLFEHVIAHQMSSYMVAPLPKQVKGFDEVYTIEEGIKKEIAFRKGNHVALISYYGNKTMDELMDAVVRKYTQ